MWNLLLSDDQVMIADSVREFLSRELPIERLRPNARPRDLENVRQGMVDLGWFGVGIPESVGGTGMGLVEETLIQRECGRYLVSPGTLATVMGAHVACHTSRSSLVSELISGAKSASLAILEKPDWKDNPVPAMALDWNGSDFLLAWNEKGMGLFGSEAFTHVNTAECLDESVTLHVGQLDLHKPVCWVDTSEKPLTLRAQILLAARLVGMAEQACDLAVEYAKVREQFGNAIGSFQAIKHRCADMGVRARLSWYQTNLASLKIETGAKDTLLQVASAKLLAAEAASENGRAGIQIHGGIGFQAECDAHWFLKRAHLYDQAGGNMQVQTSRIIAEPSPLW